MCEDFSATHPQNRLGKEKKTKFSELYSTALNTMKKGFISLLHSGPQQSQSKASLNKTS